MAKHSLLIAGVLGALGVFLGAFGAHTLPDVLETMGVESVEIENRCEVFETAVKYHLYHALALVGVGLVAQQRTGKAVNISAIAFLLGIIFFSGCLYLLVFTGIKLLGAVVPLGGSSFIVGWTALALAGR